MNKPILLNTPDTDKILSSLATITLMKGQNQPTIEGQTKCYLCNEDSVLGECQITKIEKYYGYPGRIIGKGIGINAEKYNELYRGITIYGWTISEPKRYDEPVPLSSWGIKKPPKDWKYIDGAEVEVLEETPAESQQDAQESEVVAEDVPVQEESGEQEYYGRGSRRLRR